MGEKGAVFDALLPLMHSGATLFGYTILNRGVRKTLASRAVYFVLRKLRVINGVDDSAEQLTAELNRRFNATDVRVIGCVAIFTARMPR
jgi:RNA-binding protein YhbY